MTNPELENFLQKLRQLLEPLLVAEYARGEKDAIGRIVQAAQGAPQHNGHDTKESRQKRGSKERAPRGAVDALIERVLREHGSKGAGALEIKEAAKTSTEKMVSYSGIRFALDRGREDDRYRNKNGKWFLKAGKETAGQGANP